MRGVSRGSSASARARSSVREGSALRDVMRDFALRDLLTSIANLRSLQARAGYEIARHTRARSSFVVVMLDLDGFSASTIGSAKRPATTSCATWPSP